MAPNGNGDRKLLISVFGIALLAACTMQAILTWDGRKSRELTVEAAIEASREDYYAPTARNRLYTVTKLAIDELRRAADAGDERSRRLLAEIERLLR